MIAVAEIVPHATPAGLKLKGNNMYKLLHWIFGWDYIYWKNSASQGIARLKVLPDKTLCFYQYRLTNLIKPIKNPDDYLWLTCKPEKYFPEKADSQY